MEKFLLVVLLCMGISVDAYVLKQTQSNHTDHTDEMIKNLTRQIADLTKEVKTLEENVDVSKTELQGQITKQGNRISDVKKDTDVDIFAVNSEVKKTNAKIDDLEKGDANITKNIANLQSEMKKESEETKVLKSLVSKGEMEIAGLRSLLDGTVKDISQVLSKMGVVSNRTDEVEAKMGKTSGLVKTLQEVMKNETHSLSERISTLASFFQKMIDGKTGDLSKAFLKALEQYHPYGLVFAGRGYPDYSHANWKYVKSFDCCYKWCLSQRKKYGTRWDSITWGQSERYCRCNKDSYGFESDDYYVYLRFPPYKYN